MRPSVRCSALLCFLLGIAGSFASAAAAQPLRVVTTSPDLADLARAVGGDAVDVTSLAKGPQDIHFIEPRPSFVSALHRADALVVNGLELEVGWLPALLPAARNDRVYTGGRGHIDASAAIDPLDVPTGAIDRSMGDVHPRGNPHYLMDPLNGLAVARLLRDRFSELRPDDAATFAAGYSEFAAKLTAALDGWLAIARASPVHRAVQDHRYWSYFAQRFGLELVETLEPKPGIAPSTAHLQRVIERIRAEQIPVLLATVYFDPRHARFVAEQTGVRVIPMAHQVGSRPGTDDYLAMIEYDVKEVFGAS